MISFNYIGLSTAVLRILLTDCFDQGHRMFDEITNSSTLALARGLGLLVCCAARVQGTGPVFTVGTWGSA
jgi:hypothetical protein